MAEITIQGLEPLIRRVGMARTIQILRPPMTRSVARIVERMGDYPPQPAGTTYRRTGTLGRRWTMEVTEDADGITAEAGNNTTYGPFVQSEQFQAAWMGHWQTDRDVIEELEPVILADFEQVIGEALG